MLLEKYFKKIKKEKEEGEVLLLTSFSLSETIQIVFICLNLVNWALLLPAYICLGIVFYASPGPEN